MPMDLPSYFDDFLSAIRPTTDEQKAFAEGHKELRENLDKDTDLSKIIVKTFIQGSYRRKTALVAGKNERSDLDVVIVTKIPDSKSPQDVQNHFKPFLEKHYKGKWKPNDRSLKIMLPEVDIDFVVTAAPSEMTEVILKSAWITADGPPVDRRDSRLVKSWIMNEATAQFREDGIERLLKSAEAAQWQMEPLLIPDRKVGEWEPTHPLRQIEWTWEKNADCNSHYINVVKALKWWKRLNPDLPKYPKGYPLEHIVGACCPDGIKSVAEGVTLSLEAIVSDFEAEILARSKPTLPDHGVPDHDVLLRVGLEDFHRFYAGAKKAAGIARKAYDCASKKESILLWQQLFGSEKFPDPDIDDDDSGGPKGSSGGYTPRKEPSEPGRGRFA